MPSNLTPSDVRGGGARRSFEMRQGTLAEADANKGKISVTSPIARALIGKAKGIAVEVEAPGGTKAYKVRKVEWLEASPRKGERL